MTIILEIKPETEAELARRAADQGLEISSYAAKILEDAASSPTPISTGVAGPDDMVELFAPLRGLNIDFERDKDPGREIQF